MKKKTCPDCKGWRYKFALSKIPGDIKNDVKICPTCKGDGEVNEVNQPVRSVRVSERTGFENKE